MPRFLLVDSSQTLVNARKIFKGRIPEDMQFVAINSIGMLACEQAGMAYTSIDRFSQRKEIIDLGWDNYVLLDEFCARWDEFAQQHAQSLKQRGIRPFRFAYYDFKMLIDVLSVKLLLLKHFVRDAAGCEVYFTPEPDREIVTDGTLWLRKGMNLFSPLLEIFFDDVVQSRPLPGNDRERTSAPGRFVASAHRLAKGVRNYLQASRLKSSGRDRRSFLCFNVGHDIHYLLPELQHRGFRPLIVPPPSTLVDGTADVREQCRLLWQELRASPDFRGMFSCEGSSYFELVESSLREYIESVLPNAVAHYDRMLTLLAGCRPSFALTGTINLGLVQRCRMLAAQSLGIPLVTYTEGAGYGSIITPIYDHTEVCDGDAMLCYGEGIAEYYRDLGRPVKRIIPVGSSHQQAVRASCHWRPAIASIFRVMYVSTMVDDNINHYPNNGLTSTGYFTTQLRILRTMASLPDTLELTVKPHPADVVLKQSLQLPGLQHIRVETRPFEQVLDGIDLFILDFPSTVLLSAISTDAYVFVLLEEGVSGLTGKQRQRLEKRAWVFDDFGDLSNAVYEITSDISRYAPRLNDEYALAYSLYQREGTAYSRAADALERLSVEPS